MKIEAAKPQTNLPRIEELDSLRGFALFGILLVNILVFHAPYSYFGEFYGSLDDAQYQLVDGIVNIAAGKFLFIFAFLFGYGVVLQEKSRPNDFSLYLMKRMLVLFVFGLLHILLFWFGDILASYGLLGLLLLPLLRWSNRNLLLLGVFFILFRPIYYLLAIPFTWPFVEMGRPVELVEFLNVFQNGSYVEILELRMFEFLAFIPENLVWHISKTFGLFLIGIYAARKNLFMRMRAKRSVYPLAALVLVILGFCWIAIKSYVFGLADLNSAPYLRPLLIMANVVFETSLAMGYIIGFGLIFRFRNQFSKALARTGKLALTNYIMQSLICVTIFYGYGFGYYGKMLPSDLILMAIVIFGCNVLFSWVFLNFYRVGPLENLWRKIIH